MPDGLLSSNHSTGIQLKEAMLLNADRRGSPDNACQLSGKATTLLSHEA
jgi:hypothetical protein